MELDKLSLQNSEQRDEIANPESIIQRAVDILQNTNRLSKNEARTLVHLLTKSPSTGKEISLDLNIPDSKIYPALSHLNDRGLIRVEGGRPARYSIHEVSDIIHHLVKEEQIRLDRFKSNIKELEAIMLELWEPEMNNHLPLSYIVKDKLSAEIVNLFRAASKNMNMILSENIFSIISFNMLMRLVISALRKNMTIKLAIPKNQYFMLRDQLLMSDDRANSVDKNDQEEIGKFIEENKLYLYQSQVVGSSYIVKDDYKVMHIFHHQIKSFAIISTESDFISIIRSCWASGSNCLA